MVLKKVRDKWWILTSDDGYTKLTWFGCSKEEVVGKFMHYIRSLDLDKLRYYPKHEGAQ